MNTEKSPPFRVLACARQSRSLRGVPRGFALIESLVSILIFSFGVLGLVGLEARAINFSVNAEDRNRAALFASEVAGSMWLTGSVNLTASVKNVFATNLANASGTGLTNGVLSIVPVANTNNAADITITWNSPTDAATDIPSSLTTRVILP